MSVGHTPYGIPVYPSDYAEWDMTDGYVNSPTNIADRAAREAERRFSRMLDRRLDMSGISALTRSSTIGDIKSAVNGMRTKLSTKLSVVIALLSLTSFAGLTVSKINVNDLGDTNVVVDVSLDSSSVSVSATNLTDVSEFFDNVRTSKVEGVTSSFSNAVVRFSPPVPAQDFDAMRLTNNAAYFDSIRTNRDILASVAFSNAVRSVSPSDTGGLPHLVPEGDGKRLVSVQSSHQHDFVSATSSTGLLQKVVSVDGVVRVPDLQSVWVGGRVVGDRVIGGETVFSKLGSGGQSASSGEISGKDTGGNELSVRYDLTAVVMSDSGLRTNDVQWTLHCPDQGISSLYDQSVAYPYYMVRTTSEFGFSWYGKKANQSAGAEIWYESSSGEWVLYLERDGYTRSMTMRTAGKFSDSSVTFVGHPSSAPGLTYTVTVVRGTAASDKIVFVTASAPTRKRIATEDYADSVSGSIQDSASRIDADRSVRYPSQRGSGDWSLSYWSGNAWVSLTNLSEVVGWRPGVTNACWRQTSTSSFSGHSITNLSGGVELFFNNGFWVLDSVSGYETVFQYVDVFPWDSVGFVFAYRGEAYRVDRPYPWGLASDRLALESTVSGRLSVSTNGVPVQIEPYYEDDQVKWRLK